ncbi:MAG: VWA domain-containing protein [Kiritimatiellae bacterium]|nr:VWA domain-containing protein [Kiritimatiellia bacterium]
MNEELLPAIQDQNLPALPIPHCPVMLVLDTSHSMWGQGMQDQQAALRTFHKTLGALEFPDSRIEIAAVGMGDNLKVLQPFTPLAESAIGTMSIRPKGDTPVGGALRLALDEIRRWTASLRGRGEGVATPQLILLSDGESSDDFSAEAAEIRSEAAAGRLCCRAVAIGARPNLSALAQIAGGNVSRPDYGRLRETFAAIGEKVSQTYEDAVPEILMSEAESVPEERPGPIDAPRQSSSGRLAGRTVLVDGTNVCFWADNGNGASLGPVLALARALDAEGADWQACFDASTRHHLAKGGKGDDAKFEELLRTRPERFVEAPAGICADVFLLQVAAADGKAIIVSNDRYRDHEEEYPFVKDKSRLFRGIVFRRHVCVPNLGLQCSLGPSDSSGAYEDVVMEESGSAGGKTGPGFLI